MRIPQQARESRELSVASGLQRRTCPPTETTTFQQRTGPAGEQAPRGGVLRGIPVDPTALAAPRPVKVNVGLLAEMTTPPISFALVALDSTLEAAAPVESTV